MSYWLWFQVLSDIHITNHRGSQRGLGVSALHRQRHPWPRGAFTVISLQGWREAAPPPESCGRASDPQGAQPRPDVCVVCTVGLKVAGDPCQSIGKLLPRGQSHEWYFQETLIVFSFCWIYLAFHVVGGPASHLDWTLPEFLEKNTPQPTLLRLAPWSVIQKEKAVSFHCLLWWLVYCLVSQLHHPHRSPVGLSIKPWGGQSGGGWALPLLLLPSHNAEPHPPSLHTTKIKGMERKQVTHPRQMWWTHVLESQGPEFQSQGLELPVPGLPLPEQLILTRWASVSSQTPRLKQANALKAFSKVLASSQGWTLRKRE